MTDTLVHIVSAIFVLYFLVMGVYAGFTADFIWIWPLTAAALELVRFFFRVSGARQWPPVCGWIVNILCALCAALFLLLTAAVIKGMAAKAPQGCEYAVVLGAQVKGERPSRALRQRIERAVSYANENPDTIFVLSGGQGPNEGISEAECMRREMVKAGIAEERLVMEDKSTSTLENLIFSDRKSGCADAYTGIITNSFHETRAHMLAVHCGYTEAVKIPAASDGVMTVHFIVRETFALVKEFIKGNIRLGGK